jgi:hypothetical protein
MSIENYVRTLNRGGRVQEAGGDDGEGPYYGGDESNVTTTGVPITATKWRPTCTRAPMNT